ncbi:MAG: fibronectin type III domain-containing protein [Deltaproteobacteria bacterium]|nr:fibronectin type III domain-containing protein [Deltaproteobacteria bacterium]
MLFENEHPEKVIYGAIMRNKIICETFVSIIFFAFIAASPYSLTSCGGGGGDGDGGGGGGGSTISLAWDAPTTNVDGSPLTDLAGYRVYVGTASRTYASSIDVGNVTTYSLTGLIPGQTYYIAVTAYDTDNNESSSSNEVSGTPW